MMAWIVVAKIHSSHVPGSMTGEICRNIRKVGKLARNHAQCWPQRFGSVTVEGIIFAVCLHRVSSVVFVECLPRILRVIAWILTIQPSDGSLKTLLSITMTSADIFP
jgi:hypothetical protein